MDSASLRTLEAFGQRHPGLMLLATIMMGVATTLLLLSDTESTSVLYQAF